MIFNPSIISVPQLLVIENKKIWTYTVDDVNNGAFNVYLPPLEKSISGKKESVEMIFLPITPQEFRNHWNTFIGYRFTFKNTSSVNISFMNRTNLAQAIMVEFEINRVFYKTRGKNSIIITGTRDPIFPAAMTEISGTDAEIKEKLSDLVTTVLISYCPYYASKII